MIQNQWHFYIFFFSYLAFRHYTEAQATCESHAFILKIYTFVLFFLFFFKRWKHANLLWVPPPKVLFFLPSNSFSCECKLVDDLICFCFFLSFLLIFSVQQKKASVWLFSPVCVLVLPVGWHDWNILREWEKKKKRINFKQMNFNQRREAGTGHRNESHSEGCVKGNKGWAG